MLLEDGLYPAVVTDVSLYLRGESERLTAAFRLRCENKELLHREWIELNDGTISDRTIKRMRACFPKWDGSIEALEQGGCVRDVDVDVTIENEQDRDDPEKWWTRTRYMDPRGGASSSATLPPAETRATLVSKYGARFRALSGGTPVKAAGSEQKETKAGPPAARPPVEKDPATESTLEACWEAVCKKHPDEMREQVSERWFELLARVVPEKDQADFGPEDWGTVLTEIKLPF